MTTPHYKPSAIALAAPPMSPTEYRALVEDIRLHGLREPVVLIGNRILDGVHRLRACEQLGIKPRFVKWRPRHAGDTPAAFAASKHTRRSLTDEQRAVYAARLATLKRGRPGTNPPIGGISQTKAAAIAGAKLRSVQRAKVVVDAGIERLTELVAQGKLSLDAAEKLAKFPENKDLHTTKEEKEKIAERGPKAVRDHLRTLDRSAFKQLRLAAVGQRSLLPPLTPEEQARQDAAIDVLFRDSPMERKAVRLASRNDNLVAQIAAHASQINGWLVRLRGLSHEHARYLGRLWLAAYEEAKKKLDSELDGPKVRLRIGSRPRK